MNREHVQQLSLRVATTAGWVHGTLRVPGKAGLVEFLNGEDAFLRLTDVTFPGRTDVLPFVALRRDAVRLVLPENATDVTPVNETVEMAWHEIWLWMAGRTVRGRVRVPRHTRVSDQAMHWKSFVPVWNAVDDEMSGASSRLAVVLVHVPHVLAFVEPPEGRVERIPTSPERARVRRSAS
ncbi:MAG: hypothetical protein AB2A00_14865 [Myxococcota bacterium]